MKKIKVLAKNHGYFNSVFPEKYEMGDWIDLKAGKTVRMKKGEYKHTIRCGYETAKRV